MANIKFTQLPDQGLPTDATIVPTVASGTNYTITGANLKTYVNSTTGNITGGNLLTGGAVTATGTVTGGNLQTGGAVTATGNITGGNIQTGGVITATGNITGNYIFGNGSQLTGISVATTYGNANVNSLLSAWGSNALSTTGNVTASYHVGNGSLLSNITGANVTGTVPFSNFATSATTAGTAATVTSPAQPAITSVGTLSSLSVTGNVASGANISAAYFLGNGSGLTGIVATSTYGNANVAAYLPTYTGAMPAMTGALTTTANVTGGNLITGGAVTATGNVSGSYIKGNGSQLTGLVTSIVAGSGISINVSTGAVTITNTGNSSGNIVSNSISNGTSSANIATANGNIVLTSNGNVLAVYRNDGTTSLSGTVFFDYQFLSTDTRTRVSNQSVSAPVIACYQSGTPTGYIQTCNYSAVQARATPGAVGRFISINDSPTYAGQLAYWTTTPTAQWRYVGTNTAV